MVGLTAEISNSILVLRWPLRWVVSPTWITCKIVGVIKTWLKTWVIPSSWLMIQGQYIWMTPWTKQWYSMILNSTQLLNSTQPLNSTQFNATQLNSTQPRSWTQLSSTQLSSMKTRLIKSELSTYVETKQLCNDS